MSSSTSNSSLARSRSLRVPAAGTFKLPSTATTQAVSSPSYVSLFLTNLRLLDLDLREDWPDISAVTFSTRDAQQNQKKRIQSVEWALYRLFALWDPDETRNKLQPFFPPLEQLQSLNLRAALFRCLDILKKIGVLGRDTVLRKTMLDECKGDRLEEVLAVFSNAVLRKVLQEKGEIDGSIARDLAFENFSYHGERSVLSALIIAHKVSLGRRLQEKNEARAKVHDFEELLSLNERRIVRRHEQLKEIVQERGLEEHLLGGEVEKVQKSVMSNWVGDERWLSEILFGESVGGKEELLAMRFDRVWKHVEGGSIEELEARRHTGLVEQLDARIKDQDSRLARWQAFGRRLEKSGPISPSKKVVKDVPKQKGFNLGFNSHQELQVGRADSSKVDTVVPKLGEYRRLIENMKKELADVGKPKKQEKATARRSLALERVSSPEPVPEEDSNPTVAEDDGWSSASEAEEIIQDFASYGTKSLSRTPSSEAPENETSIPEMPVHIKLKKPELPKATSELKGVLTSEPPSISKQRSISPLPMSRSPPLDLPKPASGIDHEAELADQILNTMAATSPSPKKRHTLSLAERTRLSISRNTHAKFSDFNDEFEPADLPRLSIKPRHSLTLKSPTEESEPQKHADLIERTRKSMAGFEAAQRNAQIERRKSVKEEKKRQRQSSYFPRVEEEDTAVESGRVVEMLEEGGEDYDSVFKSRPKIATSPAVSPTRLWDEERD